MATLTDTNTELSTETNVKNVEDFLNEEAFFDEENSGDEMEDEDDLVVRGDRALGEFMRVMTTGLLPIKNAYYPLSKEASLLITEKQFSNIGLIFMRFRGIFCISLDMWIDLRGRLRKINDQVEKRFKMPISETDYPYDLMHLYDGDILRVKSLGEDVIVQFCDEKLFSDFFLTVDEWREFYKNSFDINTMIMDKWFNFVNKKAMY